jgi:methyl-accepting chemotaxis protein
MALDQSVLLEVLKAAEVVADTRTMGFSPTVARLDDSQVTTVIAQHGLWKNRLLRAISSGESTITPDAARRDDRCVLGQWLYGDGRRVLNGHEFGAVRSLHASFHAQASELLSWALTGQGERVREAVRRGTRFSRTSNELASTIDGWRGAGRRRS